MNLAHELHVAADRCCLILHGEIDLTAKDQLRTILQNAISLSHGVVDVDFRDVTFLDCGGIGVLVAAHRAARVDARIVYVSHTSGIARRVLEITGVLTRLTAPSPPVMNLSIDTHDVNDGVVRLAVAGEVDFGTCDRLHAAIKNCIADGRIAQLIVDLDRVTFLDSSGINALVQGRTLAAKDGIAYYVTNPHNMVQRVLDVAGVLSALTTPTRSSR